MQRKRAGHNDGVNLLGLGASKAIRPQQNFKDQEDLGMINGKSLCATGVLAAALAIAASPVLSADGTITAPERHELRHDRREIRRDRREIHGDRREIRGDRKDLQGDRRELVRDRHELRHDIKSGAGKAESRRT